MPHKSVKTDKGWIIYDPELINEPCGQLFERQESEPEGSTLGRGQVVFFSYQNRDWVLKHYQRGGLIRTISHDSYLYTGLNNTRMVAEFHLLQTMHARQLPVPKVLACRVQRKGLSYKGDIITEKIPEPSTFAEALEINPASNQRWQQVGELIGQFHRQGIYHADLNANNIMQSGLGENAPLYLIDFDRAEKRAIKTSQTAQGTEGQPLKWQHNNLDRLKRSLIKLQNKAQEQGRNFYFEPQNLQTLISGYNTVIKTPSP